MHSDGQSVWSKFQDWASSFWNLIDLSAIVLFYVAFCLRFYEKHLGTGQTIYAFDVGLWILRLLDVFHAHRKLGPYVYMIGKMVGLQEIMMSCERKRHVSERLCPISGTKCT